MGIGTSSLTRISRTLASLLLLGGSASAATTFEIVGPGFPTGVSADGSVIVGTLPGSFEVFRWTVATGTVPLGMCSGCVLGRVGGNPDVSADGTVVSGNIITDDSLYVTPGIWRLGTGWEQLIPPVPPDGGLIDDAYGSSWAVSGDGSSVAGYYWRPGQPGGLAHAFHWSAADGLVDLGSAGRDSRVSGANHDGTVFAGWDSDSADSHWRACVWVNGAKTLLSASPAFTEAHAVSPDGSIVAGMDYNDATHKGIAALWTWSGASWARTVIGTLPGTFAYYGEAHALDLSANGRYVVGVNHYDFSNSAGFIWDPDGGMLEATAYLAQQGISMPADFLVTTLTGISADGRTIVGAGLTLTPPYLQQWFRIRRDNILDVPPVPSPRTSLRAQPNPMLGATVIAYAAPAGTSVDLAVFDAGGRRIRRLVAGGSPAAEARVRWDGRDDAGRPVPAGVYYLGLQAGAHRESRRIVVLR